MLTTPGGRPASTQISAKASAVSGVYSAGLSTTVLPQASAGAIFQASISSGKFQGMICPQTPTGRAFGKLAGDQRGPAGVMVEMPGDERHVDVARLADRLAVVEALQHGEEALALLDEPGERVEVLRPLMAGKRGPGGLRRARGGDGRVDVGRRPLRDAGDRRAGRGVADVEQFARRP